LLFRIVVSVFLLTALLLISVPADAQDNSVSAWNFFLGEWQGKGAGEPGNSSAGGFTFSSELYGKILVRRNFAEYAATKDKPAFRHDDLMVTYFDPQSNKWRADYWDSEGHIIHYTVQIADGGRSATFVSDPVRGQPSFRLTYTADDDNEVGIKFEIAPPEKPSQFATYITARAVRKPAAKP
jgi:hypothetical protein